MFDIYIKDFNQNGRLVTTETLVQSIPSATQGELKLISPTVKAEMGNAEQFNFSIEGGTKFYDAFNQMKTFMRVVYDGDTIFYGRVLTIENGFTGTRRIRLEGPLAFLNDTSIEGQKEEARPKVHVYDYLKSIIDNHNTMCGDSKRSFTLGEVPGNYHSASSEQRIQNAKRKFGQDGWTDSKGAIEDLRSHYGGYLRVRCNGHKNSNGTYSDDGHYLDWLNHYFNTSENSQTIEVGKNVIDISTSTEIDNIFTVVIPIGNSKSTSYETADGEKKATGSKHFYVDGVEVTVPSVCSVYGNALNSGYHTYDDYAQALNRYGRIVKTVTFDDAETPAELLTKCHEWIKNNYQGEVTKFTVKAVDMHQIGDTSISKIMVGDRVRIIYPIVKEDGSVKKAEIVRTCLSINYDLYNPENNSYTFGIPANILTKSYGVTKQGKSTKDASTTPKSSGGGAGNTKAVDWLDKVTDWLIHHKVCYRHKASYMPNNSTTDLDPETINRFPYTETYKQYMKGPYSSEHLNYFIDTDSVTGVGRFAIWKFHASGKSSNFNQKDLDAILAGIEKSMKGSSPEAIAKAKESTEKIYRESRKYTQYTGERIYLNGTVTHQQILECKIIEYVYEEYGIDLKNFSNAKMPSINYTDENGIEHNVQGGTEPGQIVTAEMIKKGTNEENDSFHIVMTPDGRRVASMQVEEVDMYGIKTKVWKYFEVDPDDPDNVISSTIRDLTLTKLDSDKVFGSMIKENWMDGDEKVVSTYRMCQAIENYKDGELVVARVEGDVVYIGYGPESNPQKSYYTSVSSLRHMDSVAGNVHYEPDENGVMQLVFDYAGGVRVRRGRRDENGNLIEDVDGNVVYGEFGVYDKDNLTGGMIVEMINGETTTRITGDHIKIGETQDGGVTKDIVISAKDSSQVGIVDLDNDGNPVLSAGTKVWRTKDGKTAAFGLWDSSGENIDAGIVIEKINNHTTTKISGDVIYLQGETLAETMYSCDFDGGTITGLTGLNSKSYLNLKQGSHIRLANFSTSDKTHHTSATPYSANSEELVDNMIVNAYFEGGNAYHVLNFKHLSGDTLSIDFNDSNHTLTVTDRFDHKITFRSYVGGWDAAYNRVDLALEDSTANTYTITTPSEQVDGAAVSRKYFLTDEGKNYVKLYTSVDGESVRVARYFHNRYDQAWKAACAYVSYPETDSTSSTIDITYPESTKIDGGSTSRRYYLTDEGKNYVKLYTYIDGNEVRVGRYYHARYDGGWKAACAYVSYPTTASTSSTIDITYPESTKIDGGSTSRRYYLTDDGDNYVKLYTSVSGTTVTVARYFHNKYAAGQNSVSASAPTYGSGPSTFNEQTSITVYSNTSTGKSSSGTITLSKGTYVIGTSGKTNHCVKLQNGSTVIGLISTESVYTDGFNAGEAAAVASHTITGFDINSPANLSLQIGAYTYTNNQYGFYISSSGANVSALIICQATWKCDKVDKSGTSYLQKAAKNLYYRGWNDCISAGSNAGTWTDPGGKEYIRKPSNMSYV